MTPIHVRPTSRSLYLGTLFMLQLALVTQVAPPLARMFKAHAMFASLHDGWTVAAHLAGLVLSVAGAALALQFPLLAIVRHTKRGAPRFAGLPRWAIRVAIAGAALFACALAITAIAAVLSDDARGALSAVARSAAVAGTAVMAAGALCAELLRRSVPPVAVPQAPWQCETVRIRPLDALERSARAA
jgi:hypothetical protein